MERVIRAEMYAPEADNEDAATIDHSEITAEVEETTKAAAIWAATEEDEEEDEE
jgi:hypothetical protein